MTYDLYVLRVEPGRTWQDALAQRASTADEPEWPPAELSGAELAAWQRIAVRVGSEIGPVTTERERNRAALTLDGPGVVLDYSGERVAVQIPHGYEGVTALRALYHGYAIARIAAEETGAVAVDPTIGRRLAGPGRGGPAGVVGFLTARGQQPQSERDRSVRRDRPVPSPHVASPSRSSDQVSRSHSELSGAV